VRATQRDFATIAPKAVQAARIFFFCGPDESGVRDAADRICELLGDAGERVELSGAELRKDPARLADEAHSTSLFGDSRHIWLRAQGDEAHDALANLLESDVAPCPVLVVATGATDKSRSAKLLADRPDALVAMFYPPELRQVASAVRRMAGTAGLKLDDDLAERMARAANLDTRVAQSEIDKLAMYLDVSRERPGPATAAALDAIGARTAEDGFGQLVNAVLGGSALLLAAELRRCRELKLNPVALLLALERRTAQLATLTAKLGPRGDIAALVKAESGARRIFWKEQADVAGQLRRWRGRALERLQSRLVALHQRLLADSQAAEVLLEQELSEITRMAARLG
jgi:DNA polymerase-3 subunit delta